MKEPLYTLTQNYTMNSRERLQSALAFKEADNVTLDYSRPGKPTDNPYIETTLKSWDKGSWQQVAEINYSVIGNKLELSIPRNLIGMDETSPNFYFKWADNHDNLTDISSFLLKGDICSFFQT